MPTEVLIDVATGRYVEKCHLPAISFGIPTIEKWGIDKDLCRGGKRQGVDVVRVDNGRLSFQILPTRGMGIWNAELGGDRIGWHSPVGDGPVHPAFVDRAARGGLGWLQGFDELMVRCGLETNGPPIFDAQGHLQHGLHGRIANVPAHYTAVNVDDREPHTITVEGQVDETELFFGSLRLTSHISTVPDSNAIMVRDRVTNLSDSPASFELLYHWNFGPPHLEEGSRFLAPVKTLCPRDKVSIDGLANYHNYGPPGSGPGEHVFYFALHSNEQGQTLVLLRNRAGDKGVSLRFSLTQLPCFTLWKCLRGNRDGYVTGLEPAVNFPNTRAFEEARGRVRTLDPGTTYEMETTMHALNDRAEIAAIEAEISNLQAHGVPRIMPAPTEPFAPEA